MIRRYGKWIFMVAAAVVVAVFIYISTGLVRDLSAQERQRMEIWADATREIVASFDSDHPTDIDFLLRIIESNTNIPVLLTDSEGNILQYRNFDMPPEAEGAEGLTQRGEQFLRDKLRALSHSPNVIDITIAPGVVQHLYYEDSTLLRRLQYYPWAVLAVLAAFVIVVYLAMLSSKRAEQNMVWVGLSKETAHQLGTPISSLMAWLELLPEMGVDADTVAEMDKDVTRLSTIASRFSKIGSVPQMVPADFGEIAGAACRYMATRISQRITLTFVPPSELLPVEASAPLLEWVMENLIKNAVDATEGAGRITVTAGRGAHDTAWVEVEDTGKGLPRNMHRRIFKPGFTTKKRGWGLGLTLARRIVAEYHRGEIYVKSSTPGVGTTFRITLPLRPSRP